MARDWLDTGNHGIRIGLEYGSVVDAATGGAITADTVNAKVSNLEVWIDTDDWPFTDTSNRLEVSGSAVTDDAWSNLNAGTSSSKKLKELSPQSNALEYGNPVTRACTVSLQNIEAAGETLNGTHNFTFPARPYHIPYAPAVSIGPNWIAITGHQTNPGADRYWEGTHWYIGTNDGAWEAVAEYAPNVSSSAGYMPIANSRHRGLVYSYNAAGSAYGVSGYYYTQPNAPAFVSASRTPGSTTVSLSWQANGARYVSYYNVYRSLNGGGYALLFQTSATSMADSVALNATATYYVQAVTPTDVNVAVSVASPTIGVGLGWNIPNIPGAGLNKITDTSANGIISGNVTNATLDRYWQSIEWCLQRDTAAFGTVVSNPLNTTTVVSIGLPALNSRYQFAVRARNSNGVSDWGYSNYIYTKPLAPGAFVAARAGAASETVNISWTNLAMWPGTFLIERSLNGGGSWTQFTTAAAGATSATDTLSVASSALYRMRLTALDGTTLSDYTGSASVPVALITDKGKLRKGANQIDKMYVGTTRIRQVAKGSTILWVDGDA